MNKLSVFFFSLTVFLNTFGYSQNTHEPLPCIDKTFGIIVHLIRNYDGFTNITEAEVQGKIDGVNSIFDSICISFEICEIRYINNYQYDDCSNSEFELMDIAYGEANRINLYFAFSAGNGSGIATQGGIDSLLSGGIVAEKTDSPSDISHLFGHYFGLYNTWQGSQSANAELVDGSNCATAGDSICDTPADPFYINPFITWQDGTQPYLDFLFEGLDANGSYYNPQTGNIMSDYLNRCYFTYGQYRKMASVWLNSSMKMW